MCFKQERALFSVSRKPLKLIDLFTYIGGNISSTISDLKIHLTKAWTAINRLSIIRKSYPPTNKIKRDFFQAVDALILLNRCTTWTPTKMHEEKAWWELYKNAMCCFEEILKATHHKPATVWPLTSNLTSHPSKTIKKHWELLGKYGRTDKQHSLIDLYTTLTGRQRLTSALCGHWMQSTRPTGRDGW